MCYGDRLSRSRAYAGARVLFFPDPVWTNPFHMWLVRTRIDGRYPFDGIKVCAIVIKGLPVTP